MYASALINSTLRAFSRGKLYHNNFTAIYDINTFSWFGELLAGEAVDVMFRTIIRIGRYRTNASCVWILANYLTPMERNKV